LSIEFVCAGLKPRRHDGPLLWRRGFSPAVIVAVIAIAAGGCRQDMHDTPRVEAYEATDAFPDGSGNRTPVEGTVARGHLDEDELLYTGKVDGQLADEFPFPVTKAVLERGQERFNIYCSPCHGRTGMGNGMIVSRGLRPPPSYHDEKLRTQPVGHFFDVMTNGFGAMQDYRAQVGVQDRWAIAAYIRALQLSQHATVDDVPADKRSELDAPQSSHEPAGEH
jgi:mono/diheme cytochrome c family protein